MRISFQGIYSILKAKIEKIILRNEHLIFFWTMIMILLFKWHYLDNKNTVKIINIWDKNFIEITVPIEIYFNNIQSWVIWVCEEGWII